MGHIAHIFFCLIVLCDISCAMQNDQKPSVIFNAEAVVNQDISAKKKVLVYTLFGRYIWGVSDVELGVKVKNFLGVSLVPSWSDLGHPMEAAERDARRAFFKFLSPIQLPEKYAVAQFAEDDLPQIMNAWIQGKVPVEQVVQIIHGYIDDYVEKHVAKEEDRLEIKKFYYALVHTTFDRKIMRTTCTFNRNALAVLDACVERGIQTYMVGHCAPESYEQLKQDVPALLAKFKKVLFSHQCKDSITPETKFDDQFWREQLEQDGTVQLHECIYVDNTGDDKPPHYKSDSRELARVLSEIKK